MGFLLLGLDSLIVCAAVGPLVDKRWRLLFAALFGVADGVAFLIGSGLGWRLFSDGVSTALQSGIVVALGLYLCLVVAGTQQVAARWPVGTHANVQSARFKDGCQVELARFHVRPPFTDTSTAATMPPTSVAVPVMLIASPFWTSEPAGGDVMIEPGAI